jgi:FtsZ-binding cell division protein ZapB
MKGIAPAVIIAVVVTALVVGTASFFLGRGRDGDQVAALQERVDTLQEEKTALEQRQTELENQVAALEEENQTLKEQAGAPSEVSRQLPSGWEQYFPTFDTTTLTGEPVSRIQALFGEPPFLIRSIAANPAASREIRIYLPGGEDPTGVYLFFKGGRLHSSRIDEFNGLYGSGLLDDEDFWLR